MPIFGHKCVTLEMTIRAICCALWRRTLNDKKVNLWQKGGVHIDDKIMQTREIFLGFGNLS